MFQLTKRRRNISLLIAFIFIVFSIQSLGDSKSVVKAQITTYQFDFGSGTVKEDYIQVKSDTEYSSDLGYGWESISGVQERIRESNDQLKNDFCFSNQKMSFKINLPAGTYSVRTIIGDSKAAQVKMNVSAEDVLKLDRVSTLKANQFIEEEFIVDVRDNQLNLSFEGMEGDYTARINALEITKLNSLEVVNPYPKPDSDDFPVYTDLGVTVGEEELNLYTSDWRNVGQFEYSGTPTVIVTSPVKIQSVTIRPSVYGIEYQVNEKVCTFTMPEFNSLQSKVEVKVTGTDGLVRTVDILGDSIEIDRPTESSEDVYYFGSGVSTPGTNGVWTLENVNNKIIYIDRGAVLQARVNIKNSNNITVRGRGMFRDSRSNKESVSSTFGFYNVSHLIFEDIILGKARNHQIFLTNVKDATIKNIKQASSTGNTDGITINSGCEDILVDNSYLMVNDDTIVINSDSVNEEDMNNIVFQNIVMGNDNNGYKLSFRGYSYGVVNDILFKNIYTLKTPKGYGFMKTSYKDTCGVWLKRLENLTFENVYIENSANSQIMNYTYNEPGDGIARINAMSIYSNVAKFDFGSGAVESEYTQISENTAYSSELGYGFESTSNIKVRDRGGSDNLKGDFCFSENPYIFKTDLPNGNYSVRILSGDTKATQEKMNIFAEDTLKLEDVSTSKANEFIDETFWVMVEDGQLTLRFESAESGKTIRINGIEINAVYADFDFGTGSVKEGYKQVTNETEYSAESGYGWDSTTSVSYTHLTLPTTPYV